MDSKYVMQTQPWPTFTAETLLSGLCNINSWTLGRDECLQTRLKR